MTLNEALGATPLVAQLLFTGVGIFIGIVPLLFVWERIEVFKSETRLAKKILDIREEYIQHLETRSQEERDRFRKESARFTKLALEMLEVPESTDIRLTK